MLSFHTLLKQALEENNLSISTPAQEKLIHFLELISKWNRIFNLTAITKPRDMVYLHLIDSLIIHPYLQGEYCLDVGSGAGLPGIPLAILYPQKKWALLDKNNKKTRFLTQVVSDLNLANVQIIHKRCEDFHPEQCFDTILSRAFGAISLFVETTTHLLCPGGRLIAMKGKYPHNELHELPTHCQVQTVKRLGINGAETERHIVILSMTTKRE
jgi:16S rRNA (guanine527-N7)-methyltransferase